MQSPFGAVGAAGEGFEFLIAGHSHQHKCGRGEEGCFVDAMPLKSNVN